ncbi:hypothetical protein ACFC08_17655 [Streptomyces sp. NPDC056112]|uniref:hypothetical protein n=1 Tax=Streptomyces sp. NPDC056112 TaxID=3345715 RepID=UPI0035DCC525
MGKNNEVRDEDADYLAARIADYQAYRRAGQKQRAAAVADVLRTQHGYNVDDDKGDKEPAAAPDPAVPETTAVAPPPEAAVEPAPEPRRSRKAVAKKPTPSDGK